MSTVDCIIPISSLVTNPSLGDEQKHTVQSTPSTGFSHPPPSHTAIPITTTVPDNQYPLSPLPSSDSTAPPEQKCTVGPTTLSDGANRHSLHNASSPPSVAAVFLNIDSALSTASKHMHTGGASFTGVSTSSTQSSPTSLNDTLPQVSRKALIHASNILLTLLVNMSTNFTASPLCPSTNDIIYKAQRNTEVFLSVTRNAMRILYTHRDALATSLRSHLRAAIRAARGPVGHGGKSDHERMVQFEVRRLEMLGEMHEMDLKGGIGEEWRKWFDLAGGRGCAPAWSVVQGLNEDLCRLGEDIQQFEKRYEEVQIEIERVLLQRGGKDAFWTWSMKNGITERRETVSGARGRDYEGQLGWKYPAIGCILTTTMIGVVAVFMFVV